MAPRTLEEMLAAVEQLSMQLRNQALSMGDPAQAEPLEAVRAAFEERTRAEQSLVDRVADARAAGISWANIGRMTGTTGEAARQRYGRTIS